jgi:hypothetical protein
MDCYALAGALDTTTTSPSEEFDLPAGAVTTLTLPRYGLEAPLGTEFTTVTVPMKEPLSSGSLLTSVTLPRNVVLVPPDPPEPPPEIAAVKL